MTIQQFHEYEETKENHCGYLGSQPVSKNFLSGRYIPIDSRMKEFMLFIFHVQSGRIG